MKGKLIVIEGTDCSGKETQCKRLIERLTNDGVKVFSMPFPRYDTPTGRIVGGPLQGKPSICESYFGSNAASVPGEVASLYYAADRFYNIGEINDNLNNGVNVILDRYTTSNMAFQGGKFDNIDERVRTIHFIEKLEYELLGLPRPDHVVFLHMPYNEACILKAKRSEVPDKVESDEKYLRQGEKTYIELASMYNWDTIECVRNGKIRSIDEISEDVYKIVGDWLNGK